MFKLIKSELYDGFQCTMDECPDNCCDEEWQISIDDRTYEKYRTLGIESLDCKISAESPRTLIRDPKTGRCPFITENGLCAIHATHGEEYLSETCRSYPRFATDYGPVVTQTLGLSCPVVAASLLRLDHILRLEEEVFYENRREIGKPYLQTNAEKRMKACIAHFSDPQTDVSDCLVACLNTVGSDAGLPETADEADAVRIPISDRYPYLEKNIAVSYLFEHLMLETKNAFPDYGDVICECAEIIAAFRKKLSEVIQQKGAASAEEDDVVLALYRVMRQMDHA